MERGVSGKHLSDLLTKRAKVRGSIPKFPEWWPLRLIPRNTEHRVEGVIAGLYPLVSAQHDQRISNRVENSFGKFTFVDGLIDVCTESSHITERQYGAG